MSTPSEVREAQRAARKQRILDNKNDRMSKVKGEYNQHRLHDSDEDEDKLSKLLGGGETGDYVVIEPANSGARIALFVALALSLLALQHFNYLDQDVGLMYPYLCVQIALLSYMHSQSYLFRKMSSAPLWSKALILLGMPHEESIRCSKYVVFVYNLLKDFLVLYFTYHLTRYQFM